MTEQAQVPVEQTPPASGSEDKPKDVVSYETHRRLLDEKKKIQQQLDAFQREKDEAVKKELEVKGEYQKLLELTQKEKDEAQAKAKSLELQFQTGRKANALLKALENGVDEKFFSFLPLDEVLLDPETGEVNQTSVAKAAEAFRKNYPELLKVKNGPKFPATAPQGNGAEMISLADWKKLDSKEMKKWRPHQIIKS